MGWQLLWWEVMLCSLLAYFSISLVSKMLAIGFLQHNISSIVPHIVPANVVHKSQKVTFFSPCGNLWPKLNPKNYLKSCSYMTVYTNFVVNVATRRCYSIYIVVSKMLNRLMPRYHRERTPSANVLQRDVPSWSVWYHCHTLLHWTTWRGNFSPMENFLMV